MNRVLVLSCILILASHRDAATIECADVSSATASGCSHGSMNRVLVLSCILILASHRDAATIERADVS